MDMYRAAVRLGIWPVIKAKAEVWLATCKPNIELLEEIHGLAKQAYHTLSLEHHPDKGGKHDNFVEIQKAYESVHISKVGDIIHALGEERRSQTQYFEPGSDSCKRCERWSSLVGVCITVTCAGFQAPAPPKLTVLKKTAV